MLVRPLPEKMFYLNFFKIKPNTLFWAWIFFWFMIYSPPVYMGFQLSCKRIWSNFFYNLFLGFDSRGTLKCFFLMYFVGTIIHPLSSSCIFAGRFAISFICSSCSMIFSSLSSCSLLASLSRFLSYRSRSSTEKYSWDSSRELFPIRELLKSSVLKFSTLIS